VILLVDKTFTRLHHVTLSLDIYQSIYSLPYIMEQLTSSLAPPRASPKSNVASSSQQVAGSVAKRYFFSVFLQARSDINFRLSNELMTLMVCGYMICNNVGLILLQMSSSPGIVSLSCIISNRDLHLLSVCLP
jgi:hypothetical protein